MPVSTTSSMECNKHPHRHRAAACQRLRARKPVCRTAATAIGAVGGALVGESVVCRCSVVNRVIERNAGYDVSYSYNGRTYNAVMPNDPGTRLRVNVAVTPVSGH